MQQDLTLGYATVQRRGERWMQRWWLGLAASVGILLLLDVLGLLTDQAIVPLSLRDMMADGSFSESPRVLAALLFPAVLLRTGLTRRVLAFLACVILMGCAAWTERDASRLDECTHLAGVIAAGTAILAIVWHAKKLKQMPGLLVRVAALAGAVLVAGMMLFDVRDLYVLPKVISAGLAYDMSNLLGRYVLLTMAWGGVGILGARWVARNTWPRMAGAAGLAGMMVLAVIFYPTTLRWRMLVSVFGSMDGWRQEEVYQYGPGRWTGARATEAAWELLRAEDWGRVGVVAYQYDWIRYAIQQLPEDKVTAEAVDAFLQSHPQEGILHLFALRLAREGQYKYAPRLLQHALFDRDWECLHALQLMHLPQAAWGVWDDQREFTGDADTNRAIMALLMPAGAAARERGLKGPVNWAPILHEQARGRPAGMPEAVGDEADRVVGQYERALAATQTLNRFLARHEGAFNRADFDRRGLPEDGDAMPISELGIDPIHSDGGLAALTKEVDRFVGDVNRLVKAEAEGEGMLAGQL